LLIGKTIINPLHENFVRAVRRFSLLILVLFC